MRELANCFLLLGMAYLGRNCLLLERLQLRSDFLSSSDEVLGAHSEDLFVPTPKPARSGSLFPVLHRVREGYLPHPHRLRERHPLPEAGGYSRILSKGRSGVRHVAMVRRA